MSSRYSRRRKYFILLFFLLLFQESGLILTWKIQQHSVITVVSFDMQGTIHQFVKQVKAQKNLTQSEKSQAVKAFSRAMITAVKRYAAKRHVTIVLSQAVVAGAPDRTRIIQTNIAAMMHALRH